LESLSLSKARLTDRASNRINALVRLRSLTLEDCGISKLELHDLDELQRVTFQGQHSTIQLKHLPALSDLAIQSTRDTENESTTVDLEDLPNVKTALLEGLFIGDDLVHKLQILPRLEDLVLASVTLRDGQKTLKELPSTLRRFGIVGVQSARLEIADLPQLHELAISNCGPLAQLTCQNLPALETLLIEQTAKLTDLRLERLGRQGAHAGNSGKAPAPLQCSLECRGLEKLAVSQSPLDAATIASLGNAATLEWLRLDRLRLNDSDMNLLRLFRELKVLELPNMNLSAKFLPAISAMPQLRILNLAHNRLSAEEIETFQKASPKVTVQLDDPDDLAVDRNSVKAEAPSH
jgi:Leucine-rich repeat (LRR) protein